MKRRRRFNFDNSAVDLATLAEIDRNIDELEELLLMLQSAHEHNLLQNVHKYKVKYLDLAALLNCRAELLALLAKDKDSRVREEVARRLGSFVFVKGLAALAADEQEKVRQKIVQKMNKTLTILAKDKDSRVRQEAAQKMDCF